MLKISGFLPRTVSAKNKFMITSASFIFFTKNITKLLPTNITCTHIFTYI